MRQGVGPAERRTSSPLTTSFVIKDVRQHGNAQQLVRWRKWDVIRLHPSGQGPLVFHPCPPTARPKRPKSKACD